LEKELEKCTFTPELNPNNKAKSKLYDWVIENKYTIAGSSLEYQNRLNKSMTHKKSDKQNNEINIEECLDDDNV